MRSMYCSDLDNVELIIASNSFVRSMMRKFCCSALLATLVVCDEHNHEYIDKEDVVVWFDKGVLLLQLIL